MCVCVCGCVVGVLGGGHRYVRLCYYSLRVGWRHKKKEEWRKRRRRR